jgi:hypothetical protein
MGAPFLFLFDATKLCRWSWKEVCRRLIDL